jgi:hypothetical protein
LIGYREATVKQQQDGEIVHGAVVAVAAAVSQLEISAIMSS